MSSKTTVTTPIPSSDPQAPDYAVPDPKKAWSKALATSRNQIVRRRNQVKPEAREYFTKVEQASEGLTLEACVSQGYTYVQNDEVKGFLLNHPQISQTLIDAMPRIKEFFGEGTAVALRVSCDQESDSSLSANIRTNLEVSEARAARKAFNVSWWMRQPDMDELPLTFNLEYV